jgi:FAD/FMN-containing dehydrogenase
VIHPIAHAREVLLAFDTFAHESVDDISTMAAVLTGPDGELAVALAACFCGPIADGERVLRPLRTIGSPVADLFRQMPYPVFQTMFDASFESGFYHYWNASFLERITEPVIDATVAFMKRKPSPNTVLAMQQLHGAAARVPADSTAFVHRRSHYDFGILSVWANPAESRANIEWTKEFFATVQPHLEAGVYVNSLGEDDSRVHAAYGANYPRLLAIKRQYDPGNLFRLNHNIDPLST